MRPILDFDPVTHARIHGTSGTAGHSSEAAPESSAHPEESEFFRAGEAGSYQGGPADPAFEPEPELLLEPERPVIVRTPEQEARRARFARGVAATVGALAALLAFGVVRTNIATASSPATVQHVAPPAAEAAPPRTARPAKVEPVAPVVEPVEAEPVAKSEPPAAPVVRPSAPVARPAPVMRRAPVPAPEEPAPAPPPPPVVTGGDVPTAAFATVR